MTIIAHLLDPRQPDWFETVDELRRILVRDDSATLFPPHFLKVILPKIGGHIAVFLQPGDKTDPVAVGFLFPRELIQGKRGFTLRFHRLQTCPHLDTAQVTSAVSEALDHARIYFYDPRAKHTYVPTVEYVGEIEIGRPSEEEAFAIPALYQRIWGSPANAIYPADIHSLEFHPGTSLVARISDQVVGFLFGFYRFDSRALPDAWQTRFDGALRLESQVLGVVPEFRGRKIGFLLKKVQADLARRQGISIVNWTADPLQFPNAALNFSRLKAIAFDFFPDHYPFQNELNRVATSRFELTWPVSSQRVIQALAHPGSSPVLDLAAHPEIVRVNQAWKELCFDADSPALAIEIPANWTGLQAQDLEAARHWRENTDRLFAHYIGKQPGQYVVTGTGVDGNRRFLVAERADDRLLTRLGQ